MRNANCISDPQLYFMRKFTLNWMQSEYHILYTIYRPALYNVMLKVYSVSVSVHCTTLYTIYVYYVI